MKDFWDYVKGIAFIFAMVATVYLCLAEDHEWWPFNQNNYTPKEYTEELSDDYWVGYDAGFDDGYIWGYNDGKEAAQ